MRIIPAMLVASTIHTGAGDMAPGWVALNEWVQRNHYRISGAFREIFLTDSNQGSEDVAFELQFPIQAIEAST